MKGKVSMELKIKYVSKEIDKIEKISIGDWIDMRSAEDIKLKAGETAVIKLGVAMELPEGYEALVVPRSSTLKNFGVMQTNSVGVIDNSYRGEWRFPMYAVRDTEIHVNDRVCQFRILKNQPKFNIVEVDELESNTERSCNGFGSTGKN